PVVSLFAPTVRLELWRPWRVPHVVLGDQDAACATSRARECPVAGHPCLAGITAREVTEAVRHLTTGREGGPALRENSTVMQVSTAENGTAENGRAENGTAESGTAENGTAENGTAENGTAENGTAENGTAAEESGRKT